MIHNIEIFETRPVDKDINGKPTFNKAIRVILVQGDKTEKKEFMLAQISHEVRRHEWMISDLTSKGMPAKQIKAAQNTLEDFVKIRDVLQAEYDRFLKEHGLSQEYYEELKRQENALLLKTL